ncbi:OmpL47-type beta-barrel domain-containing protein [Cytobacillus dafuensis]|uniref:OmpL47-type beta-barrel domain-containing protein n=1 Tax=Cytobacillus dafuensis TaxID=1742359 RepID=UPI001625364F|nr:hypothetical protein [Cytobacillus dafuensis]
MIKKLFSIKTFLVVMILMYQFNFLFGELKVSANTNILPPSNLTFQSITPDDGKLTWSAVYGATGYNVYEIKDGQLILLGKTNTISYSLNDLPEGSYRYVVSTLTSEGESGPSAPVNAEIVYPNMLAPATLSSVIRNGNDIVLSWGSSQYAQKYNIYQISESGERTLLTSTTATTYTIAKAEEGLHTYSVSAYNALYGESPDAEPIKVEVGYPEMKQPSNLSFTITNGTDVNIKWQGADYATSYKIYQDIDGKLELQKTVTGTSVTFSNQPAGDYTYKVYSYSDRFGESTEGSQISLTVGSIVMTAPNNVTYKIQNTNDVVLTWGTVPYADSYKVYELNNGEKTLKSTVKGTTITYSTLKGGEHEYIVHSYSDRFGESEAGTKVSFSIDTVEVYPPKELSYKIQNGNDIVLSWSSAENATNYKVYQIIDGQKILKNTVTGTSITFTNMSSGSYQFEVRTNSTRFGESEDGAQVSFTLDQINMSAPKNVKYEIKNGNDITLSWDAAENATHYRIYQVIDGKKVLKTTVSNLTVPFSNLPEGDIAYEIYSYNSRFGESNEGTSIKISVVYPKMLPPENVNQTTINATSFTLKWDSAEYATNYKVYQIVDGQKILKNNVTGTSISYSNMQTGSYKYEVYSYSTRFGESEEGTSIDIVVNGQDLPAPENVSYSISNGNDLTLKWNAVQYATSYNIYQIVNGEATLKRTVTSTNTTLVNFPAGEFNFVIKANSLIFGESSIGAELKGNMEFPIMERPKNLTYSVTNGNDITLKWSTVPYATSYKIYQIIDGEKVFKRTVTSISAAFANMPEGDYEYVVHSYSDRFGESLEGSALEFKLASKIMEAPSNFTKTIANGNDIVLRWNASTYAQEYRVYEVVEGEKVLKRKVPGTTTTFTNMPEGDYEYVVYSYSDRFGESPEGSSTQEFNLTWPIMQAPDNFTKTITNGNDIVLRWNASTYAQEYRVYEVVEGEKVLKRKVPGTTTTFTNMPEGDYEYVVYSYSDRFGESPVGSTQEFNLTWPIVGAPTLTGSVFNANNITLSWKTVPWANEYRVYKVNGENKELIYKGTALNYKVYNLTEDVHSFEVTAYSNRFGESVPSESFDQKIVYPIMESPNASLKLLNGTSARISWDFVTYANNYNIYEIIEGKPVLLVKGVNNLSYDIHNLSYADHEYYVTSYSNSFGESKPSQIVIAKLIVDTEAPETKINAPTEWVNQNQFITLEAIDNEVGVEKTYYSINGSEYVEGNSFTVEKEGVNKISYYSVDKVGNKEEVKTAEVKIDKIAPNTSSNAPETWVKEDVTVTLKAEDELSGVAKTYYSINGSEYVEGSSFIVKKEGITKISYYSVDAAGNKEEVKTLEVKIDKTAPTVSLALEEEYKLGATFTLDYYAEDHLSGIMTEEVTLNGKEYKKGDQITLDQPGEYNLRIKVTDAVGLSTVVEKTFAIYIPITLEVLPKVMNGNKGIFTVKATLPKEYQSFSFDISSVRLNGVSPVLDNNGLQKQAEKGHFKFNREEFVWKPSEVNLELRGYLDNKFLVVGKTTVEVKK